MSKRKVIVNIYGGVVQDVFAEPDIEVIVVDWDVDGVDECALQRATDCQGDTLEAVCYQARIENLNSIKGTDCGLILAAIPDVSA